MRAVGAVGGVLTLSGGSVAGRSDARAARLPRILCGGKNGGCGAEEVFCSESEEGFCSDGSELVGDGGLQVVAGDTASRSETLVWLMSVPQGDVEGLVAEGGMVIAYDMVRAVRSLQTETTSTGCKKCCNLAPVCGGLFCECRVSLCNKHPFCYARQDKILSSLTKRSSEKDSH